MRTPIFPPIIEKIPQKLETISETDQIDLRIVELLMEDGRMAALMAFYLFSGWKGSFFGDLHGQGMDAVEFFTQKKVISERWPKEWS